MTYAVPPDLVPGEANAGDLQPVSIKRLSCTEHQLTRAEKTLELGFTASPTVCSLRAYKK